VTERQCQKGLLHDNYEKAFKRATTIFHEQKNGTSDDKRTHKQIVDDLNEHYHLDGMGGKEGSRKKKMLAVSTIHRYVNKNNFGCAPKRKGGKAIVSVGWKRLIAVHINVTQVSTTGETDIMTIKATILASVMGTDFEGKFNLKNAWEDIRRINADTLVPARHMAAEDIRFQWCRRTNVRQHLDDMRVSFLFTMGFHYTLSNYLFLLSVIADGDVKIWLCHQRAI
jgi:hypothetical protein